MSVSPARQGRERGPAGAPPSGGSGGGATGGGGGAARWKAAAAAVLLLLAGGAAGVAVDRAWLLDRGPYGTAGPLTAEAMARSLDLPPERARSIRLLLDSLDLAVAEAAAAGPDSLRAAARRARAELERALPPGAVPRFRAWMRQHHRSMMGRMHPGGRPGMMGPGTGDGRRGPGHMEPGGGMGPGGGMMMGRDSAAGSTAPPR